MISQTHKLKAHATAKQRDDPGLLVEWELFLKRITEMLLKRGYAAFKLASYFVFNY